MRDYRSALFAATERTLARLVGAVKRKNFRCDFSGLAGGQGAAGTLRGCRLIRPRNGLGRGPNKILDFLPKPR